MGQLIANQIVELGLDYQDQYRNLRHLAVLEPADLANDLTGENA